MSLALRRLGASLVAGGVATAGIAVAGPAPRAAAAPDPVAPGTGAAWLVAQLGEDDLLTYENFGYPTTDVGLSIDAMLALDAVGGHAETVAAMADAVAAAAAKYTEHDSYKSADDWSQPPSETNPEHQYESDRSNATAKALAGLTAVEHAGAVVAELKTKLEAVTIDSGADAGRITDGSTRDGVAYPAGDYANVFGQAFAVRALHAVGSAERVAALDYLLGQQNANGSFPEGMDAVGALDDADRGGSVDATAVAVAQLIATTPALDQAAVTTAIADAVAWLLAQQASDGSFGGTGSFGANANETGLAGWSLRLAGESAATQKAAIWLRSRQVSGLACDATLGAQAGAVAYNGDAFNDGRTDGITAATRGQWLRSSAQALPALLAAPATGGTPALAAPRFVKAGSTVTLRTAGLAPGARGCVSFAGSHAAVIGSLSPTAAIKVPAGTKTYNPALTGPADLRATTRVTALAPKTLTVTRRSATVVARGTQRVVVTGMVTGERVVVRYKGVVVARGTANANGAFAASFGVGRVKGWQRVYVTGQFDTRTGSAAFKVV